MRKAAICFLLAAIVAVRSCSDTICAAGGHGGAVLDKKDWPPTIDILGHAAWTYLHATASYMPRDVLNAEDKEGLRLLVNGFSLLYPSLNNRNTWNTIIHSPSTLAEYNAIQERNDVILWVWKVHNCITAHIDSSKGLFPETMKLDVADFILNDDGNINFQVADMSDEERQSVLNAVKTRWVAIGGIDNEQPEAGVPPQDLPPDRKALGRAAWTMLHTFSVYLPATMNAAEIEAFAGMITAIKDIYPCSLCRHHFRMVYPDPILQQELHSVKGRDQAILFLWKMHNIVTTNQHPDRGLFPKIDKEITEAMFTVPTDSAAQLRLGDLYGKFNATLDNVLWKYNQRWKIVGGLDISLHDFPTTPQCVFDPKKDSHQLHVDIFLMAMCPFCAKAMRKMHAEHMINCHLKCNIDRDGKNEQFSGIVHWNIHYVGMENATGNLEALHGPNEEYGDKLELCSRELYTQNFQYLDFIVCMDQNITVMPSLADTCASHANMDLAVLRHCAATQGHELLAKSFAYSSSRAVEDTPTFMLNDHLKIRGLKKNMTAIMCHEMYNNQKPVISKNRHWLAQVRVGEKPGRTFNPLGKGIYSGPIIGACVGFLIFALVLIFWKLRPAENTEEMRTLLGEKPQRRR